MASSSINASDIPDVEVISLERSTMNRSVVRNDFSYRSESRSQSQTVASSFEPPERSRQPEIQTSASPTVVIVVNNTIYEKTASRKMSNPPQAVRRARSPDYELPGDIQGLYNAAQERDEYRAKAAFEELKKRAKGGVLKAIDCVSKCYINGYGCSMNKSSSDRWQKKYQEIKWGR
jgi:hypothetical protein